MTPREPCIRFASALMPLALAGLLLAGCSSPKGTFPLPGFAGVPQAIHRSTDHALPLSAAARVDLVQFMAARGNRASAEEDPPRAGQLRQVEAAYGPILDRLQQGAPLPADLREGSAFSAMFETNTLPLVVHDARVGWEGRDFHDPGTDGMRALVAGDFVFAFYARRVVPATNALSAVRPNAWDLSPAAGEPLPAYGGLVVFSRNFAIPTLAR